MTTLQTRHIENMHLGITKVYYEQYDKTLLKTFYVKCGYSTNNYQYAVKHVNDCLKCKRHLGLSNSQITSKYEVMQYFLLGKKIDKYASNLGYRTHKEQYFDVLNDLSNTIAWKKGNIIYVNYEYQDLVNSIYGFIDKAFNTWTYIYAANDLGIFDLKICEIPLDTLRNIQPEHKIMHIEIMEPIQDQYSVNSEYDEHSNLIGHKSEKQARNEHLDDKFFKVTYIQPETNQIVKRSFIWQWDETAKCLIEVTNECKNYQEALLCVYPKEIKNRSGTLRQGEYFFEPTNFKCRHVKHEFTNDKRIRKDKNELSNHYATYRITIFNDPYQYVSGTIRHVNGDHRMLKLKKNVWYRVHKSEALNAWSINLRSGMRGD